LKWSYTTGAGTQPVQSSPAVANGVVYVGSDDYKVYALNASTGALPGSFTIGDIVETAPAVANGVVHFGSDDGNVYALNASTGALLWSYGTGGGISSPAVANGVVYVDSYDGISVL
jgi:eukaryotic-like serine/threonine-protein kinase